KGISSTITVESSVAFTFAPCRVMDFVMLRVSVQLAVPFGTITVSPSWADATAELTSLTAGLLARIVPASARLTLIRAATVHIATVFHLRALGGSNFIPTTPSTVSLTRGGQRPSYR